MSEEPQTLIQRRHAAKEAMQSEYSAIVAFILRDNHFDPRGYDQTMLTIVLSTFLAYLYTRSWQFAIVAFIAWFLLESLTWFFVPFFSSAIEKHLRWVESRDFEPILDWVFFIAALFVSLCAIEFSILNNGAGSIVPIDFPTTSGEWAGAVAVLLVSLLSSFAPLYYISFALLQLAIWLAYIAIGTDLYLWISLRASIATLYYYAWFRNPISFTFTFNAAFSLASATFILSLITGLVVV